MDLKKLKRDRDQGKANKGKAKKVKAGRPMPEVELLKQWEVSDDDFYAPGVLIRVKNGKGLLREVYAQLMEEERSFVACMMGDKPLFQLQGDEYYCPTCEKIMRSGYGLNQGMYEELSEIRAGVNQRVSTTGEAASAIFPLLKLLRSGFYVILDTTLHPTDGNGNFFWERLKEQEATGSCLYYLGDGEWGRLRPHFTVATEPARACSKEQIEYYLEHPGGRAIAYYMDGYITALLDGHHKAFAAALRHEDVPALVIMPGYSYTKSSRSEIGQSGIRFGDMNFTCEALSITEQEAQEGAKGAERLSPEAAVNIWNQFTASRCETDFPFSTEGLAEFYPTAKGQAVIERCGVIDTAHLDRILMKEEGCEEEEACQLLEALEALKHERLRVMAMFFSKQPYSGSALYFILEILAGMPRDEETENFLIERMVALEQDYPDIKKMILSYL